MGRNFNWDVSEKDWITSSNYPVRATSSSNTQFSSTEMEKAQELAELLDADFGFGFYIPSPKTFKEAC